MLEHTDKRAQFYKKFKTHEERIEACAKYAPHMDYAEYPHQALHAAIENWYEGGYDLLDLRFEPGDDTAEIERELRGK